MAEKSEKGIDKMKWEARQRLTFIEMCLFWRGRIKRANLMDYFGISGVQATADMTKYQALAPANMVYDATEKAYLVAPTFEPVLTNPGLDDLYQTAKTLENVKGTDGRLTVETLPPIHRQIDPATLRAVLQAIQNRECIEIQYQSMKATEGSAPSYRWISPHALAHSGKRWHVRAYCYSSNKFKDFLLARILDVRGIRKSIVFGEEDVEWNETVSLEIVPHPGLSDSEKKVIETDFGMVNGVLTVTIRKALRFYFEKLYSLDDPGSEPAKQQIILRTPPPVL